MSLSKLPNLTFPVSSRQVNALMENVVRMNVLDAGLSERDQKAIDIELHINEIMADTAGAVNYTGQDGHRRLVSDAFAFVGEGVPIVTRHGDLKAAYLAIAFNDAQAKLAKAGMPRLTDDVALLRNLVRDLLAYPVRTEDRISLFLSYLRKKDPV